ncbi:MAG: hypothetical protein CFE24_13475 [Flavobacterium sp. BFFFF2]|nr:MAG: hypothetical protein CFE24_13475 [Flavobacterium sp. BFFFF2]
MRSLQLSCARLKLILQTFLYNFTMDRFFTILSLLFIYSYGYSNNGENHLKVGPTVIIGPSANYSTTAITVLITAQDGVDPNPTIFYTTDGSNPTLSSNSASGSVSIPVSTTTTITAFAKSQAGLMSAIVSKKYFINEFPPFTVYVKVPANWTSVFVHHWGALPAGSLADSVWPGAAVSQTCNGWYKCTFTGTASTNLIVSNGVNGAGNQTVDLFVAADGWYDVTYPGWVPEPAGFLYAPCLYITPPGGTFPLGSPIQVGLSATDYDDPHPIIYYTTDGSTPTTASPSALSPFVLAISTTTILKAIAYDQFSNFSELHTENYTFAEPVNTFKAYFKPPVGWPIPKVYYWNATPVGVMSVVSWPGVSMSAYGNGWYQYTFTGLTSVNMIFNNGSGGLGTNQTPDVTNVTADIWYDWTQGLLDNPSAEAGSGYSLKLFPVPSSQWVNIESGLQVDSVEVYDLFGRLIDQVWLNEPRFSIEKLAVGTYLVKMTVVGQRPIYSKIVKM